MPDLKVQLLDKVSPHLRLEGAVQDAAARLAEGGRRETLNLSRLALDSNLQMESRLDALTLLAAMQEPEAEWTQCLLECDDRMLFIETLKSIRTFGPAWALWPLVSAARATGDPARRAVLAWTLAAYPASSDAERVLIDIASDDTAPAVREHAIESLGEFRSARVASALLHFLAIGSPGERFWALFSLGNQAESVAIDGIRGCLTDHTLIPGLGTIADEASRALAKIQERS